LAEERDDADPGLFEGGSELTVGEPGAVHLNKLK
jgi:hypothetical protein